MTVLSERTPLHLPDLHLFENDGITYAVDPEAPNWIAVDERGESLLTAIRASGAAPGKLGTLARRP